MTVTTRGSPVGGNDSQGQAPDGQSQPPFQQNQTSSADSSNENSPATPPDEQGQGDAPPQHEDEEPTFPHTDLAKLDDMINRPRWVVPVLPKGELEVLLEAAINLSKKGLDVKSEACQRFFRDGLTVSFTKILMDEAVSGWKFEIHRCIINNTHRLVELCVAKLSQDWFPLLDLLAMALNPHCKFHIYNGTRPCESVSTNAQLPEDELFARSSDPRSPKGWLVDLINKFGTLNGFQILHDRFINGSALSVQIIAALIKPFGQCYEFLSQHTVKKYFIPIIEIVPQFLGNLTDEELKKEAKNETKNDALSMIIKSLKNLASRIPGQEETVKNLEIFRLKMILRLLQISSFNGKMNALNEINKVISSVSYYTHRHGNPEEEEWLTAERMAEWIQQNNILSIVLRDSLHQPQYVEKLEKILRFVIKEKALTLQDLDNIWAAQAGKHEAIVKNVHDLLAKLAWDFSPEQLDHLFDCFKASWTNASKKQREKLLELIRRLAEDDKDGVMAHKVLNLLWNLAHSDDVPVDIMDLALSAHIKILDYSCSQDRDTQKIQWIDRFIEELRTNDKWVIPALKQIREICSLFGEAPQNLSSSHFSQTQRSPHVFYRHDLINQLQHNHALVTLVAENLATYMNNIRPYAKDLEDYDPQTVRLGSRYSHVQEVQERLNFLRFLLKDGQLWLCAPQAKQIWKCLAENAVYLCDREACFKWYSKLMGDEPDLDPDINKDFFESNVLQLDPSLLTENGMKCFERFFKAVNCREGKLVAKRRAYMMDDLELIGLDYLWRVVIQSNDDIANRAIDLLKEIYTNLGPRLQINQVVIHEDFIQSCFDRLKASYDTLCVLDGDEDNINCARQEAIRMVRVLTVLREYINECDSDYHEERTILPMSRAFRGKHLSLIVRFPNHGRQVDDLDIWSHTNDTVGSVRRCILNRIKANVAHTKIELFMGGELIDSEDDRKLIGQLNLKDKSVITAKLTQVSSNMPSSPDSSSDSSTGSPGNHCNHYSDGPNPEVESCLPGVVNLPAIVNLLNFFLLLFIYDSHRERERQRHRQGEAGSMHWEPDVGFDPGSPGSHPGPKAGHYNFVLNWLFFDNISLLGNPPLPNPFGDPNLSQPIMPIQQNVADILFVRTSYVKKIIEDCSNSEETIKLLRFCCWENPQFSSTVLSELLWQVAYSYTYELRPYLDLLLQILLIEDSWQTHRIHNALKGIPDDRDGLFDTIQRSKNHYQKRAYQCIKCMVALFSNCPVAYQILQGNGDLKRKWTWAVEWLGDELERRPYTGNPQYAYNNWSPPVQSNETSNGYFLERSHSARMTLAKACELCPEEEPDDQDAPDEHESSLPEDTSLYPHSSGSHYQQNNHVHGPPYTGPAAHHLNNHQKTGQLTQEIFEGSEEVSSSQMKDQ
uniref:ubiquitinyl hydrolase 1 n=1 Tax=Canis lupus familiaris TaxID=9615 RepID=A0A8I3PCL0_CANLF